ncbi:GIY-YIG nuclease family protein [Inconstantimicrobium mannanitabidum]|uniref:Uncharacterized protein n=1 Tax=Inconstantimicrobium mannanitabidum TaxID=1604901 RepID=A0ACB5RAL6_9CLOT|nr:GIY-YIG nuclease family protein [Clostridium sp. TW13]GKX66016.1 hypothetical protein rsdtw13_12740 [Clostridium sp. TW13]
MSYIYGIFLKESNKCLYIGKTQDYKRRNREHFKEIEKGIHKIKQLNTYSVEHLSFEVLCTLETDNSLVVSTMENFYNSLYKPINKCVDKGFRGSVTYAREKNEQLCEDIIEVIKKYY